MENNKTTFENLSTDNIDRVIINESTYQDTEFLDEDEYLININKKSKSRKRKKFILGLTIGLTVFVMVFVFGFGGLIVVGVKNMTIPENYMTEYYTNNDYIVDFHNTPNDIQIYRPDLLDIGLLESIKYKDRLNLNYVIVLYFNEASQAYAEGNAMDIVETLEISESQLYRFDCIVRGRMVLIWY